MKKKYILYKCKVCGCEFDIDIRWVKYAEEEYKYIACPLDARHRHEDIKVMGSKEIKCLMEERKAVHL